MSDFGNTIDGFEVAFDQWLQFAETLPEALQEQADACGNWSPRDVLAHQSGWLAEAKRRFQRYPTGTGDMTYNVDAFNKVFVWQRRQQSWDNSVAELRKLVGDLAQMGRDLSENEIKRNGGRYTEWFEAMAGDAKHHQAELAQWAAAQT